MNDQQQVKYFNLVWKCLAARGHCDAFGGAEYRRVLAAWLASDASERLAVFIRREANRPSWS